MPPVFPGNRRHPQILRTRFFKRQGYEAIDPIRPRIFGNDSVEWFYQQNAVMFVAPRHPLLTKNFPKPHTIVHQELYEQVLRSKPSLGMLARGFPGAVRRSIRWHLGLRQGRRLFR